MRARGLGKGFNTPVQGKFWVGGGLDELDQRGRSPGLDKLDQRSAPGLDELDQRGRLDAGVLERVLVAGDEPSAGRVLTHGVDVVELHVVVLVDTVVDLR